MHRFFCSLFFATLVASPVMAQDDQALAPHVIAKFGDRPSVPTGALDAPTVDALSELITIAAAQSAWDPADTSNFNVLAASSDPRLVWVFADMQRFAWRPEFFAALTQTSEAILEKELKSERHRAEILNQMIAWDTPTYPGYLADKAAIFTRYNLGWDKLFAEGDLKWQHVDWGGVDIDDRPYGETDEICHCIPAIDDPEVSTAEEATWLSPDAIVFGLVVNGQARAYPRRIMEVREMVNDSLGGRDLAIPYCTLCGSAQAYFTDRLPDGVKRPIMRTSGLLIRSNKVMYDIETHSIFDTFLGTAVTGPLREIGLQLDQATVITTDWASWRMAYPDTTVLVEELALGRDYNLRATRDANGPIFPIGDVDPRLPVHQDVVGIVGPDGTPVAFERARAIAALRAGEGVSLAGIRLALDAGGLRAFGPDGGAVASHEAFWFAWSQFHPDTALWTGPTD